MVRQPQLRLCLSWSGEERHGRKMIPGQEANLFGWIVAGMECDRPESQLESWGLILCAVGSQGQDEQGGGVWNLSLAQGRGAGSTPGQGEKAVFLYLVALGGEGGAGSHAG